MYTGVFTWEMSKKRPKNQQIVFSLKNEFGGSLQHIV